MAGRSRWFVGSSSTSQFAPDAISSARLARVRSPGESDRAGRVTASCARPNFASSERASCWVSPLCATKASSSAAGPSKPRRAWSSSPMRTPGPIQRVPALSGRSPEEAVDERRLPAAVRADQRDPLAPRQLEVDRAEHEVAAAEHRMLEAHGDVAASARRRRSAAAAPSAARACRPRRAARSPSRSRAPSTPASRSVRSGARGSTCPARRWPTPSPSARPSPTTAAGGGRGRSERSRCGVNVSKRSSAWRAAVARSSR